MKLIITVDTEADNQWKSNALTLKNIQYLPRFQELCMRYDFLPTYFITHEVALDEGAQKLLNSWRLSGQAEIGSHLHPWSTPPLSERDKKQRFPSELSETEFETKLKNLTELVREKFAAPKSYRAGRWGLAKEHGILLKQLGYIVDSSITPKIDWRHVGGPDFRKETVFPHYLPSGILEVPMTILYTGLYNKEDTFISKSFCAVPEGLHKRIINRAVFRYRWLRMFGETTEYDWMSIYNSAIGNNLPVIQFMIHSSELMPGGSPYNTTPASVEALYDKLENMFKFFKKRGLVGVTLGAFAKEYDKNIRIDS